MNTVLPDDNLSLIFQHLFESFGPFSRDLIRNVNLVKSMDIRAESLSGRISEIVKDLTSPELKDQSVDTLQSLYKEKESLELDKIQTVSNCLNVLRQFDENIDRELKKIKHIPSKPISKVTSPRTTIQSPQVKEQKVKEPKKKPRKVNPDEPIYCACHQFSYGDMVACDNPTCPIEWFHFGCVGLVRPPKGKWFCENCAPKNSKRRKTM